MGQDLNLYMNAGVYLAYVDHTTMIGDEAVKIPVTYVRTGVNKYNDYAGAMLLEATLPSVMSINKIGGSQRSIPVDGTPCLVYVHEASLSCATKATILTFIPEFSDDATGRLGNRPLDPGGYELHTGYSRLTINPKSIELGVNRDQSLITLDANNGIVCNALQSISYGLGYDHRDVEINEKYYHIEVYRKANLLGSLDDMDMSFSKTNILGRYECEAQPSVADTSLLPYSDKVVIQAGNIKNRNLLINLPLKHVYQLETRQSSGTMLSIKDTFTCLRLGYQNETPLYSEALNLSRGSLIDWRAKKSGIGYDSFVMQFGKKELGLLKGELYRLQINSEDVGKDSEGMGYNVDDVNLGSQYYESFGLLSLKDFSFYTRSIKNGTLSFKETLFADPLKLYTRDIQNIFTETITTDGSYKLETKVASNATIEISVDGSISIKDYTGNMITLDPISGGISINSVKGLGLDSVVKKFWLDMVFPYHMHNTPMGPTIGPVIPSPSDGSILNVTATEIS